MEYWRLELRDWARTQGGTAGWEIKLENLVEELLEKQRKESVKKLKALKAGDGSNGNLNIYIDKDGTIKHTDHKYHNNALDRAIEIIKEHK